MKRRIALMFCACTLLAVARSVSAQSRTESEPTLSASHASKIPVIVWSIGVAADQITTYRFSSRYRDLIHEENPLIRNLDRHPALLVAAGTAIDAASGWASYHLLREHPRLAQIVFYGAAAYRAYLAGHNIQMMRRADQLRSMSAFRDADGR